MKIMDISQEVFSCAVYPGDPKPEKQTLHSTGTVFLKCCAAKLKWSRWRALPCLFDWEDII